MSKSDTLTIVPDEGQISKSGNFQLVGNLPVDLSAWTPDQHAASILADVEIFERHSRTAAFVAIRVGLRLLWVRDNGEHGDIGRFIKEHLKGIARSTLANYMKVAEAFVIDAGLCDKKHRLTQADKVAPIMAEQLELFADPNAKLEGAIKKAVKWVADRGLSKIYKDLEDEHSPSKNRTLPPAPNNAKRLRGGDAATAHADALNTRNTVKELVETEFFKDLDDAELHDFALWLVKWSDTVTTAAKARR